MNKIILLGRLTSNPEIRHANTGTAIATYTLAVNRRFKREGEPDADFINCVAIGKVGEFAEKYLKKGTLISIVGRLQIRQWEDKEGKKRYATEVIVEEHYFAGSKEKNEPTAPIEPDGFYPVDENTEDEDLPF